MSACSFPDFQKFTIYILDHERVQQPRAVRRNNLHLQQRTTRLRHTGRRTHGHIVTSD